MVSIIMTEDDIRHELSMDVKRIEGIIERIDTTCKKYNDEKMDAALTILKIKSELENVRKILPHMSNLLNEEK
jgi:predicted transcriptional regulator|tara:strand:+ start:3453 stop:3671 length:219 start_codon:yes stop_codon:yes gene_type:complete